MANKETSYRIEQDDHILFSARTIPNPVNQANRYVLETKLRMQGARIIKGAHVSGHACREDHRELLSMLSPQHIIPAHGDIAHQSALADLCDSVGWRMGDQVHMLRNGQRKVLEA